MSTRLQSEIYKVVKAAVKDAADLRADPMDFIVLRQDTLRIITRRKRRSGLLKRGNSELWTEFYMKEGFVCVQDGRNADADEPKGEVRRYETLHGLLDLNDIFESAKKLASTLVVQS